MSIGADARVGETVKLIGDHGVRLVEIAITEITAAVAQAFRDCLAHGDGVAVGHQLPRGGTVEKFALVEAEVAGPDNFVLAHGDAVFELV